MVLGVQLEALAPGGQPSQAGIRGNRLPPARPRLGVALREAPLLGSDLRGRIGVCTAPRCDRVYVDASRNGTRRFCSTSCQNRVKTAAFRARQAQAAVG